MPEIIPSSSGTAIGVANRSTFGEDRFLLVDSLTTITPSADVEFERIGLSAVAGTSAGKTYICLRSSAGVYSWVEFPRDFAAPNDLTNATVNAEGTALTAARSDHDHAITGFQASLTYGDTPTTILPDDAASQGVSTQPARGDHVHAIAAATAVSLTPDIGNSEGDSTSFARANHTHDVPAATPGTIQPDDVAAEGVASSFARSDHTHAIAAASASTQAFGDSATEGVSTSFSRADHKHAMMSNPIPSGLIAMWHGTIASIPSGWVICDGNNGTPNLLSKFVIGVATAATNPGTTGGATSHTHGSDGGHTHDAHTTSNYGDVQATQPTAVHTGPSTHSSDGSHTHDSQSNLPPYYAVAYIMKT